MNKTNIFEYFIETEKIDNDITIACCSDIHLWKTELLGLNNIEILSKTLNNTYFDYLLIPGDLINDTSDLFDISFRNSFFDIINILTCGKLTIYTLGNHDIMTLGINGWCQDNENILKDTLKTLPQIIFLEKLESIDLTNPILKDKGYTTSNINIIGAHLPFSYFENDKENDKAFIKYWNELTNKEKNPCKDTHFNILLLHALKSFINTSKKNNQLILPGIDFAIGGHYHNGGIPNYLSPLIKYNRGLISPNKKLLQNNQRGIIKINEVPIYLGGYTNFRVENKIINKLYGGPSLLLVHICAKKENVKKKIYTQ